MKNGFKYISIFMLIFLSGCKDSSLIVSSNPDKYYTVTMDGEYINYPEEDEVISEIIDTVNGFTSASYNVNYKDLNMDKEFSYYSEETLINYEQIMMKESTEAWMKSEELIMKLDEISINSIELYDKNKVHKVKVDVEYISSYSNASQNYLITHNVKLNTKYRRNMITELLYENDRWAVQSYTLTEREEIK